MQIIRISASHCVRDGKTYRGWFKYGIRELVVKVFGRRARGRPHRMDTASQTLHQGRGPVLSHLFVETAYTRDSACARLAELVSLRSGSFQRSRDALVAAVCTQQLAASATVAADTPALIAELGRS